MDNSFDIAALDYDQNFTYSNIGVQQRKQVYKCLDKYVLNTKKQSVLEINCGTGEDAQWFAERGNRVLATDSSEKMISVTKNKDSIQHVKFKQLKIQELNQLDGEGSYDLIFSNFGGLNCLNKNEFSEFFTQSKRLLKTNGNLVLVIMPKNCIWDNVYLFLKGKWDSIGRRNTSKALSVPVHGKQVDTWYYNPKDISNLKKDTFKIINHYPIGFFVPPSYLEPFFKNKKVLLKFLDWLDKYVSRFSFLARFSDHYIIHLKP